MNVYVKEFLKRGLMFGGFGPVILGIVYLILSFTVEDFSLSGLNVFTAIVSTYLLAFVHAGVSVFNQIDRWPVPKSLLFHFLALYIAYTGCYLMNAWIPFEPVVIGIYTAIFVVVYFVIWGAVLVGIKVTETRLNRQLKS